MFDTYLYPLLLVSHNALGSDAGYAARSLFVRDRVLNAANPATADLTVVSPARLAYNCPDSGSLAVI